MLFDYDRDGKIYTTDIGLVIRAIGLKPTESEVKEISRIVEDNYSMLFVYVLLCVCGIIY